MLLSKRTQAAVAIFTAVATTIVFTGCDGSEQEYSHESSESSAGTRLVDDNGNEYTLIKNADGTETAKYDDGKEVTFKRDEDGNLNLVSGAGGLLAGLAAGYFLFHGFHNSGGSYSGNRYTPSTRPSAISSYDRDRELKKYMRDDKKSGGTAATSNPSAKSNSNSSSKSSVSSSSTAKGGFGSAGARSGGAVS